MPKLKSSKQESFAQHYAIHGNQSEAYRHAYSTERMKDASVYQSASRLLKDVKVSSRVEELQQAASERAEKQFKIDADWMLKRLKSIDEMDVADIMDDAGNIKPIRDWPKVWRTSISALDLHEIQGADDALTVIRKLKLPDKAKNLEMLGRHVNVKAFENTVNVKVDHAEVLDAARKRLAERKRDK